MQVFTIGPNEAGQRLDKYLNKLLKKAPKSFLYKMLRKKNIVLNGKKADGSEKTAEGDEVRLYLSDATITEFMEQFSYSSRVAQSENNADKRLLHILYEDENIMLLNKPQGVLSQKAKPEDISLVELVTDYLLQTGKLSEKQLQTFRPSICNRLDRNTSGIIAAGVSLSGSQQLSQMFRERSMEKNYLCLTAGSVKEEQHLRGYLLKDEKNNQVSIFKEAVDDALPIETAYIPLAGNEDYTLLLVDLITGRSHQIRAHLASIGHPIAGDTKYGDREINRKLKRKYGISCQMLHAWKISFPEADKSLVPLSGKTIYAGLPENFQRVLKGEGIEWQHGLEEGFEEAP